MRTNVAAIVILAAVVCSQDLFAHSKLKPGASLQLREDNPGIKTGPCGSMPRSATPTVLTGGQDLLVEWEEVINHTGYFRIAFSPANDAGFDDNVLATIPDDQNSSGDLPHYFSKTITVPNVSCDACTIQLIQMMTDDPANPRPYFSCGDIKITANANAPAFTPIPKQDPIVIPTQATPPQTSDQKKKVCP